MPFPSKQTVWIGAAGPFAFWAGASVAGGVAAVSKFSTPNMTKVDLLKVGKAQFSALRRLEYILAAWTSVAVFAKSKNSCVALAVAATATAVQAGVTAPRLEKRVMELASQNKKLDDATTESQGEQTSETVEELSKKPGDAPGEATKKPPVFNAHRIHTVLELVKLGACIVGAHMAGL